jgi:hypothetical protein
VHGFSALLPPIPENETTYYEILEVSPSASTEDIRRAYKKKSLMLHPDKVAQRRGNGGAAAADPETAKAQYQKVQEAHAVLADERNRRKYNLVGKSPTRYQFISSGLVNPGEMYENLARANLCDKTRLFFLVTLFMCLILLQPILICAKVNQLLVDDDMQGGGSSLQYTKWTLIFIPWWIVYGLVVAVSLALLFLQSSSKRMIFLISFCEHACWFVGQFLLALRWDDSIAQDYVVVFIPMYMALLFRWIYKIVQLHDIRTAITRMVTLEYIENHVLNHGRHYTDLTEEERHDIHQTYVVVHHHVVPQADADAGAEQMEDEEKKVQASPEYNHAVESYTEIMNSLIASILVSTTFVALVVAQVDGRISVSWWVVFVPIWIKIGIEILTSMYACCCMPIVGEEVMIVGDLYHEDEEPEPDEEANSEQENDFKREVDPAFSNVETSIQMAQQQNGSKDDDDDDDGADTNVDLESGRRHEDNDEQPNADSSNEKKDASVVDEKDSKRKSTEPAVLTTKVDEKHDSPVVDEKQGKRKSAETQTKESKEAESAAAKEEDETPVVPEEQGEPQDETLEYADDDADDDEFVFDEDVFREWESARQEAEASVMEAHAKAQANCCAALFQLTIICLIVGKLQQDYQRDPGETPGYNAFWILFPILLIFGCVFCVCACCIYGAGENEVLDHLVEQRMSTTKSGDEDNGGDEEAPATADQREETDGGHAAAVVASKDGTNVPDEKHPPTVTEQVSEIDDLD